MRLWHQSLLPYLDGKRLLGQHRECCALRGKGWGKKHATVDYVFKHGLDHLYQYHLLVMRACRHAFNNILFDGNWFGRSYRGKNLMSSPIQEVGTYVWNPIKDEMIYPEHDNAYLKECLLNLKEKGAELVNGSKTIDEWLVELDLNGV